jgi:PAT family acetyl-CoA transporter-like MFS transporter 1
VPIIATKIWHGHPLRQFMTAYKFRVTLVPLLDVLMLLVIRRSHRHGHLHSFGSSLVFWSILVLSTAASAIANTLQFNAQMTFFAHRVDPAIGGSYSK